LNFETLFWQTLVPNIGPLNSKYYNDLPEGIRFELGDSERYNKSVHRKYLPNIEHLN